MDSDQSFDVPEEKIPLIVLTPEIVADYTQYAEVPKMETDNYSRVGAPAHIWMPRVSRKPYLRTGVLYSRLDLDGATRTYYKFLVQLEYVYPSDVFRPSFAYGRNFHQYHRGYGLGQFRLDGPGGQADLSYRQLRNLV